MSAYVHAAGQRIGPRVLVAPIGRGGFSEVWRAHPVKPGPDVALKLVVHSEHAAQLRAEAKALAAVQGDGIARVFGRDLEHDPPWIALEILAGGDLRSRLVSTPSGMPALTAVNLLERIATILERVHAEGVVHGDLKPENVLFDERGRPRLADFGLSRRIVATSASLSVSLSRDDARLAGTIDYMAPELRRGERPTTRSDVYALGVLFYELLTGTRPQGVFRLPSERDPTIPPVVDRALACALGTDPRHRFATAGAFLAFLRRGFSKDWGPLARAHARLRALMGEGRPAQGLGAAVGLYGLALVGAVVALVGNARGVHGAFVGALVGGAGALGLVFFGFQRLRPRLDAQRARLEQTCYRIERQIASAHLWRSRS